MTFLSNKNDDEQSNNAWAAIYHNDICALIYTFQTYIYNKFAD